MNKNILKLSTLVTIWAFCSQNATAQQGFGTNQPSKASVIEMKSGTKGLLIPRVALTDLNNFGPIIGNTGITPAETNSLMVYNTTTDTTANLSAGYYYWTATDTNDGTIGHWQRFMTGTDEAALALDGDVTGPLDNTTVGKIQGRDVANTAPTSNQVLTWNGTAWTPTSLTPAQITDAQNVTAGSNKVTLGGTPVGASLQPFSIDVVEANLTLSNMGGKVTNNQITPGTGGQVLVTSADGSTTNWVEQFDIVPATTNTLSSAANSMTSNVNGVSSSANIINSNTLVLTGDNLESTVNGVATTPAVDLSKYLDNTDEQEITDFSVTGGNLSITIENGNTMTVPLSSIDTDNQTITDLSLNGTQLSITLERGGAPVTVDLTALTNTTNLGNGTNTTVLGDGSSTTPYTVNVATGNGTTLGVVRQADTTPSVTVTNGVLAVDPANVAITNALTSSGNQMSSTVNSGTAQTASIINTNELSLNTDNHLVSTINGVPSSALDLSAAVQAAETLTSITQDASTGVITYEREREADQTANVVNSTTDNLISYDAGAFLNATTVQGAQKTTVVESGDPKYATVSPNTPQGSNETTYTVTVKAAPRFFYMPAVVFNTDNQTTGTTTLTRDLYELYANQFNGTAHHIVQGANTAGTAAVETVNYTGGVVSSANATNALSSYLFTRGELEYHITYYDQTVFEIVGITEGGVLEYKIIGEATPMSYMNIVFVIK